MLISNTSTLVLLAKIKCLEKFIELSPPIEIPRQVRQEALFEPNSYYAKLIGKLIKEKKIRVAAVDNNKLKNILDQFNLDEGEAAAYVLFNSKKYKAILTDDGELIKLCKLEKIDFICDMAVVLILHEQKAITKQDALVKLEELHKIGRYSEKLYEHFKNEVK